MVLQKRIFTVGSPVQPTYNFYALDLIVAEEAVNEADNTSTVSYCLRLRSGVYSFSNFAVGAEVRLAGKQVAYRDRATAPKLRVPSTSSVDLLTGTAAVEHNVDGSLDMEVEFSLDMEKIANTPGPIQGSGTVTLTPIPRGSVIAAAASSIGQRSIFTILRKSPSHTYSVRYQFGDLTGFVGSDGESSDTECLLTESTGSFLIPESFYSQIPTMRSGICTLVCQTYSGTVPIGAPCSTTFSVTVDPQQCGPLVDATVEDGNLATLALTGDAQCLVKFMSHARCAVTASARCGAYLTEVTVNGIPVIEEQTFQETETGTYLIRAVDSRGYEAKKEITLEIIPYVKLTANVTASRTDPRNGEGRLWFEGSFFAQSFGAQDNTLSVRYRLPGGDWQTVQPVLEGNRYHAEAVLSELDYQQAHILETEISDRLIRLTKPVTLQQGVPVFDWGRENFIFHVPVDCEQSVNGLYLRRGRPDDTGVLRIRTRYEDFTGAGYSRQSIFLFGDRIFGVAEAVNDGQCYWWGSEGVTVTTEAGGVLVVDVPTPVRSAYGIVSPDSITVL